MDIKIASRYRPYSLLPGTSTLIPGSSLRVQVFPALLRFYHEEQLLEELPVPVKGPVEDFCVQLDLEKGRVVVAGKGQDGFFRYNISSQPAQLLLRSEKGLPDLDGWTLAHAACTELQPITERLSLGCHRKQDVEMIWRKREHRLSLPLVLRLSAFLPAQDTPSKPWTGVLSLLDRAQGNPETLLPAVEQYLMAGFFSLFSPSLRDEKHQGLIPTGEGCNAASSLQLVSEGARFIRRLFIQQQPDTLAILPSLPPQFDCGRYLDVQLEGVGTVDLEWSKKRIRRMHLRADSSRELKLRFPSGTRSFRLKRSHSDRGTRLDASTPLRLEAGQDYLLDCFER